MGSYAANTTIGRCRAIKNVSFYQTDIGEIGIVESKSAITHLCFQREQVPEDAVMQETELLKEAGRQLRDYLAGKRIEFALPLAPVGTEFMITVWEALRAIPYGETKSYKSIAQSIGRPRAARAIGLANHKNPIPILIPCHRVIGADGKLIGYLGGLQIKKHLLELENQHGVL